MIRAKWDEFELLGELPGEIHNLFLF